MNATEARRCSKCGVNKPYDDFNKDRRHKDGLQHECRMCHRASSKAWREANPDKVKANREAYFETSRNKDKAYYEANRDRRKAYRKAYYEANRDKVKAYDTAYREANRGLVRAGKRRRRALQSDAPTVKFSPEQLAQRLAYYGNRCYLSLDGCTGAADHVEHVKPLSKGGAHMLCNLRPACGSCNSRKGAKWPFQAADA